MNNDIAYQALPPLADNKQKALDCLIC